MCLAVPGRIIEHHGEEAIVDLAGNRLRISTVLTPETTTGDWVLVHAGFAITPIDESDALETWAYLRAAYGEDWDQSSNRDSPLPGSCGPGERGVQEEAP